MKNTSKSNFARKNICKYLAFKNSSSLAKAIWQLQMAGYSKVKINFYWDCDAWNEVDFLWPKLLNYQLMFFKSNFISWMSKFLTGSFHYWISPFEPYPKTFWYSKNEIGFWKHWLGLQKFWTLDIIASMALNPWGSLIYITIDLLFHKSQWGILSSSIPIYSNLHEIKMTPH